MKTNKLKATDAFDAIKDAILARLGTGWRFEPGEQPLSGAFVAPGPGRAGVSGSLKTYADDWGPGSGVRLRRFGVMGNRSHSYEQGVANVWFREREDESWNIDSIAHRIRIVAEDSLRKRQAEIARLMREDAGKKLIRQFRDAGVRGLGVHVWVVDEKAETAKVKLTTRPMTADEAVAFAAVIEPWLA